VAKTQHFDYQLSETEKSQGYTLMCCHTAASSELTLELLEASGPQDIPEQHILTQVRAVASLAPNTRLLHLQTPRSHRLRFLAGQSVMLGFEAAGQGLVQATYPVGSCPCDDRNLLFYISRDESLALSRCLFAGDIQAGTSISVLGPVGEFVLADGHRPLVFAACDGGFPPIKSLIEHALSLDAAPSLSLFWLASHSDGHFLSNHCRAWSEALDQFEYELVFDSDIKAGAHQIALAMRADLFDIDCDFYLAGPKDFVDTLVLELRAAGVASPQIFSSVV
jgi:CDP-4-dehydro-6-deoxyglucose reductase